MTPRNTAPPRPIPTTALMAVAGSVLPPNAHALTQLRRTLARRDPDVARPPPPPLPPDRSADAGHCRALFSLAAPAFAQESKDNATDLARIEVTGSNIRRTDVETASPVR